VYRARDAVARLLGVPDATRVAFTAGATASLNLALAGLLPAQGGHAITTAWEHNAVLRPLWAWRRRTGGEVTVLGPRGSEPLDPDEVARSVRPDTRLIVCTAASNVTGALLPVAEVGELARARGIPFVVDGAQVAGHLPLDLDRLPVDLWAAAGHKGLLGPQGVGVLYLRPGLEVEPLVYGGAGFDSAAEGPPEEAPDRYEAGTLNTPGILGLGAAAEYLAAQDLRALRRREVELTRALLEALAGVPGIRVWGPPSPERGVGVVSFVLEGWTPAALAQALDVRFDVAVRAGLHCAPLAHRALGTLPDGAVRASLGVSSTEADVRALADALRTLAREGTRAAAGA